MIDTIKYAIPITSALGDAIAALPDDKSAKARRYFRRLELPSPRSRKPVVLMIDRQNQLVYEGSIIKLMQGHNVAGSSDVHGLCLAATKWVYHCLGIEWTEQQYNQINRANDGKGFRLYRVDPGCNFLLPGQLAIATCLQEISEHYKTRGFDSSVFRDGAVTETVYRDQNTGYISCKFYNKLRLIIEERELMSLNNLSALLELVTRMLRYEVVLRASWLRNNKLEYSSYWSAARVKQVVLSRLNESEFIGAVQMPIDDTLSSELNEGARAFYKLWCNGTDLRFIRYYRPFRSAHAVMLDYGIDLLKTKSVPVSPLNVILHADAAKFSYPKLEKYAGMFFDTDTAYEYDAR